MKLRTLMYLKLYKHYCLLFFLEDTLLLFNCTKGPSLYISERFSPKAQNYQLRQFSEVFWEIEGNGIFPFDSYVFNETSTLSLYPYQAVFHLTLRTINLDNF